MDLLGNIIQMGSIGVDRKGRSELSDLSAVNRRMPSLSLLGLLKIMQYFRVSFRV